MNNKKNKGEVYNSIVDEIFNLVSEKGFTRKDVEEQLNQLIEICVLRVEEKLLKKHSPVKNGKLEISKWEDFLKDSSKNSSEVRNMFLKEFNSLLEEYLVAVLS
jgi:hypothetical protein